jgi:hypothetical protein
MYYQQIYCNTEGTMVPAWSTPTLTTCPHNAGHSVVAGSVTIIQAARLASHLKDSFSTSSTSYVNVTKFVYQGNDYYTNDSVTPKYLKVTASVSAGNYSLQLIDPSSTVLWGATGYTNTTDQTISIDFDTLTTPSAETVLTLQAKTSGTTLTVGNVSIYDRLVPQ